MNILLLIVFQLVNIATVYGQSSVVGNPNGNTGVNPVGTPPPSPTSSQNAVSVPNTLAKAMDQYLMSNAANEPESFNLMMQFLTDNCREDKYLAQITSGNIPEEVTGYEDLFDFSCVAQKFLDISQTNKIKLVLEKMTTIPAGKITSCFTSATCPNETSCLPFQEEDYDSTLEGKNYFLETLKNENDDNKIELKISSLNTNASCEFNYQCKSLLCEKLSNATIGKCSANTFCRKGRNLETVKANGGLCEDNLQQINLTCLEKFLNDTTLSRYYQFIKNDLGQRTCGDFSNPEVSDIRQSIARDIRAFELMITLAQDFSKDYSRYRGSGRANYHQLPNKIKELFLTPFLEEKKSTIKAMNEEFAKFNKNFETVLQSDGKSLSSVNFYDIQMIQKEMHNSKETAVYYLNLYTYWIKSQQAFNKKHATTIYDHMIVDKGTTGFLALLKMLAQTQHDSSTAPLFNNDRGQINSKRWFLSLELPANQSDFKEFYESPYLKNNIQELQYSNFNANRQTNTLDKYSPLKWWGVLPPVAIYKTVANLFSNKKPQLLDPILPPNGCKVIDTTANECGSESTKTDAFAGTNGKFNQAISHTIEKLYLNWKQSIKSYYQDLAKGLPANYIVDPELNLYAGCIQQEDLFNKTSSNLNLSNQSQSEFYRKFCSPDLNNNGLVDKNENLLENTVDILAEKIMAYSLAYSFNRNKRKRFLGTSKSYQDEFIIDESSTLKTSPTWMDKDIVQIDQNTKFFNFQHGVKKRFLNRIRNKYFFMSQLYFLIGNNYDKQLNCIKNSFGNFNPGGVLNNNLTPTATPIYQPFARASATPTLVGSPSGNSGLNDKNNSKDKDSWNGSKYAPGQAGSNGNGNSNASKGSNGSSNTFLSNTNADSLKNDSNEKNYHLGGVDQKNSSTTDKNSNSEDSRLSDLKGSVGDYNLFDGDEGSAQQQGNGIDFSDQEKNKINAALNSNQDPQFSHEDSIFTQITNRYVKNYRKIFRTERRSSAQ